MEKNLSRFMLILFSSFSLTHAFFTVRLLCRRLTDFLKLYEQGWRKYGRNSAGKRRSSVCSELKTFRNRKFGWDLFGPSLKFRPVNNLQCLINEEKWRSSPTSPSSSHGKQNRWNFTKLAQKKKWIWTTAYCFGFRFGAVSQMMTTHVH